MNKGKFGQLIREYRLKKGMTQKELADALGYDSPQFVSLLERDASKVPIATLGALIVVLGLREEEILAALVGSYQQEIVSELERGKQLAEKKSS